MVLQEITRSFNLAKTALVFFFLGACEDSIESLFQNLCKQIRFFDGQELAHNQSSPSHVFRLQFSDQLKRAHHLYHRDSLPWAAWVQRLMFLPGRRSELMIRRTEKDFLGVEVEEREIQIRIFDWEFVVVFGVTYIFWLFFSCRIFLFVQ